MQNNIEKRRVLSAIVTFFGTNTSSAAFTKGDWSQDSERYINGTWLPRAVTVLDTTETPETPPPDDSKWLSSVLEELSNLGLMLCGGAINSVFTGSHINDLDFYIEDAARIQEALEFLSKWFPEKAFISDNAITLKRKSEKSNKVWTVQLIKRFTGTPQEIMDSFDFTLTQGVYKFNEDEFYFGKRFLQDIMARKLVYLGKSHFPICAMYRTKKYQARGYSLPGSTIMHISLSIVRLKIVTYADLKAQLMGIDTMYLQKLLGQPEYGDEIPVDFGKFLADVFESIDGVMPEAEEEVPQ